MSHFIVAVFHNPGENYEHLLAPYDEQNEEYFEFKPTEESNAEIMETFEKEKKGYKNFDDFMERYYGYEKNDDGIWGYMYNPNAKWDWWQEGGRWNGFFKTQDGDDTNCGFVDGLEFGSDENAYKNALRFWEVNVEDSPLNPGETKADFLTFYRKEYYIEQYGDKETYARTQSLNIPWAFVTADGDWIENGRMGWFACHDATNESRQTFVDLYMNYIKEHPHLYVTAVDCHI